MARSPGQRETPIDSATDVPVPRARRVKRWAGLAFIILAVKGLLWLLVPFLIFSAGC